jgi:hypothetical protein
MNILTKRLEARSELAAEERRRAEGMPGQEQAHGSACAPNATCALHARLARFLLPRAALKAQSVDKLVQGERKIPSLSAF